MGQHIGAQQGKTLCPGCKHHFCSRHELPWHADFTCDEYDKFLEDNAAKEEVHALQDEQSRKRRRGDDEVVQGPFKKFKAPRAPPGDRLAKEREAREAQIQREKEEAKRLSERKMQEERQTNNYLRRKTRPCPRCRVPIEKISGCDHMNCTKCHFSFNWSSARW
ncbi:hypothetical protein F4801DRAFT_575392 [Xylaria longipes]|nr:hypothetical protein F4801DRAFT_575392 [Xylaria longipes]